MSKASIEMYVKSAVASGTLVQTKGKGASGSFKLASSASPKQAAGGETKAKTAGKRAVAAASMAKSPKSPRKPKAKKAAAEKKPSETVASGTLVQTNGKGASGSLKLASSASPKQAAGGETKAKSPKSPRKPKAKKAAAQKKPSAVAAKAKKAVAAAAEKKASPTQKAKSDTAASSPSKAKKATNAGPTKKPKVPKPKCAKETLLGVPLLLSKSNPKAKCSRCRPSSSSSSSCSEYSSSSSSSSSCSEYSSSSSSSSDYSSRSSSSCSYYSSDSSGKGCSGRCKCR